VPSSSSSTESTPLVLVHGSDDFLVKERSREILAKWKEAMSGADLEIIDASAHTVDEALKSIDRLAEALGTYSLFGSGKIVWWKDCTFLGDDRTGSSSSVQEALGGLTRDFPRLSTGALRLLISATEPDKRRSFYKGLSKTGHLESMPGISAEDKDWPSIAESHALRRIKASGMTIADEALADLVERVGPHLRHLSN
jgi:DNA polymerase-3 subunit delta